MTMAMIMKMNRVVSRVITIRNYSKSIDNFKFTWKDSYKVWMKEMMNYDDGDKITRDNFFKYVFPSYRDNQLIEDKYKSLRSYNVVTKLDNMEDRGVDFSDSDQWYINELRVEKESNNGNENRKHVVMLHGYGACNGWFYKNYGGIANKMNSDTIIHGIDMLGFGLSGRPIIRFNKESEVKGNLDIRTSGIKWGKYSTCINCGGHLDGKISKDLHWCSCSDEEEDIRRGSKEKGVDNAKIHVKREDVVEYLYNHKEFIKEVEDVFVESLERWRELNGIDKFDLIAHSFGGYVGMCYLMKYPDRVNKVVMVSPGGFERSPFAITNPLYESIICSSNKDQNQTGEIEMNVSNSITSYGFLGRYGLIGKKFRDVWNMKISLFTILRWLGPLGPKIVYDRNVSKLLRSGNIKDSDEVKKFIEYNYSCLIRASFAETAIMRVFDSTIVAKFPIIDKIKQQPHVCENRMMLWVYGQHDFMYRECGKVGSRVSSKGEYREISNAGHNMYLDNSEEFNEIVSEFLNR